jgi:hypothetical protein
MTNVINIKNVKNYDVYIGRDNKSEEHYGNPFSYNPAWGIECKSVEESVLMYALWLKGELPDVEPNRRTWILNNLKELKGKTLGCFCKPSICHGDILIELLNQK